MKTILRSSVLAAVLLASASASAQPIHGAPYGIAAYGGNVKPPFIDGQCHVVPGGGSPLSDPPFTLTSDMMHAHAGVQPKVWAEYGDEDVTVPIMLQLFHTAGRMIMVEGTYLGDSGQRSIPVELDGPLPVGDPNGRVITLGRMTFNLAKATDPDVNVPKHGWARLRLFTRTLLDNGSVVSNETTFSVYSVVDRTAPEQPLNESGIILATKCKYTFFGQQQSDMFGAHLTELRDQKLPLLAQFRTPIIVKAFGYSYGLDPGLPNSSYELRVDPDLHMGIPGVLQTTVFDGTTGNFDTLDPLALSKLPAPMGFAPNEHRLSFIWSVDTGTGFTNQLGLKEQGGVVLRSLLTVKVAVGPDPVGCTPELCPPIPVDTPTPPVVTPPVVVVPPVVIPPDPTVFTFTCNNLIPKNCTLVIK